MAWSERTMNLKQDLPLFDAEFKELNQFILTLVEEYKSGRIKSWDTLDERVKDFFTPDRIDAIDTKAPGWKKMASYSDGITVTHVTCVFLGMFMLPEFQSLSQEQQQIAKWIILFHDIDKFHIRSKKDSMHAFHSAVIAARDLPALGFPTTNKYNELIDTWGEFTYNAFKDIGGGVPPKPDNEKLPEILSGINQLFGENSPAALIVKTTLLHISLNVDINYPTPSPLTVVEAERYIDPVLFPLLRVMMLSDNEGWSMFHSEARARQRNDTLRNFAHLESMISKER
jgi:hypothetical protein